MWVQIRYSGFISSILSIIFLLFLTFFFQTFYVEAYCTGSYFCGSNVTKKKCSQVGYDNECTTCSGACGLNTDGKPGKDGKCSCVTSCNPNQGYEVPCTGLPYAQCPGRFPGLGCDCGVSYCKWKPDPPPACSYSVCGGWNPVGGYYCAKTARYGNSGCPSGATCYDSPSCYSSTGPAPTATPRPPTAVPTNQPTPTFTPSPTPACVPNATRCGAKCESCGSNGQWYLNASNGCYGGNWNLCDCLNKGGTMTSCNPPTPTTALSGVCGGGCGFCQWKGSDGQCHDGVNPSINDFCCHRECVNSTCATVDGQGANSCSPNGSSCAPAPTSSTNTPPSVCVKDAPCTCSGATAGNCNQCGPPYWCNGGKCDCSGSTGGGSVLCTQASYISCSGFTAKTASGTTIQGVDTISSQSGVQVPVLEVLPNEAVTFSSQLTDSNCNPYTTFYWEDGSSCIESTRNSHPDPPYEASYCNSTIQASTNNTIGGGGIQDVNKCQTTSKYTGLPIMSLDVSTCMCQENNVYKRCKDVYAPLTTRSFFNPGDYLIQNTQNSGGKNNTNNPCRILIRVKCPDLTQAPGSITVQDGTSNVTANNNAVGFIQNSGNRVVNWPVVTDAVSYSVRVNEFNPGEDESASWSHDCTNLLPGDFCQDVTAPTRQITYQFKPNKQYKIWVHARNSCGAFGPATTTFFFYAPKGALQTATCANLTGWTCDLDNVSQATEVKFYLDGGMGTGGILVPGRYIANTTVTDPAIIAGCGGNAVHGFNLTLPEAIKDGKQHTIYAYGENIGYFTEDRVLAVPRSVNKCADPWVKINGGSFNNNDSTLHLNKVPAYVEQVDVTDSGLPAFIAGTNQPGAVMQLDIGTYMGTSYSLPHNWRDKTYLTGAAGKFNREQYLNYVKARKNYATISTLSTQITEDGIYAIDGGTNVLQYDGNTTKKMVLIGLGDGGFQLTGNAAGIFNPSNTSIAIIAKKITVDPSVKEINAILITDTFDTGLNANLGLKIKGNLIASQTFTFNRQTVPNQNVVPPLYITQDQQKYLDLMRYLSTSIYEIQEAQ